MFRFKYPNTIPPGGGFFYEVPETRTQFEHPDLMAMLRLILAHYRANLLPPPGDLRARVEDYMCARLPDDFCMGRGLRAARAITVSQIRDFTRLMYRRARDKDFFVDQAEATRRAGVCRDCPNNRHEICSTCTGLKEFVAGLLVHRKTSLDKYLGVCSSCGCVLSAKIHVNRDRLRELPSFKPEDYPGKCWLVVEDPSHEQ